MVVLLTSRTRAPSAEKIRDETTGKNELRIFAVRGAQSHESTLGKVARLATTNRVRHHVPPSDGWPPQPRDPPTR